MYYSVIYSFDIAAEDSVNSPGLKPPKVDQLRDKDGDLVWQCTESNDGPPWDEGGDLNYVDLPKHRKYCGFLTAEQFEEFVDHCCLYAEDIETMGSIGAPGMGFGPAPAISFTGDGQDAYQNAYITPVPDAAVEGRRTTPYTEEDWDRTRSAVISKFAA